MEKRLKSRGEELLEQLMRELDPASERYQVLATARRFKSSWAELGERLLELQRSGAFHTWGYDSFEEYCAREIRIRRPTAEKLTQAYRFLEKEAPQLLVRGTELKPLPDYRSVELLRQAREELDWPEEEYAGLRKAVLEDECAHPTVQRRFRETAAVHSPPADASPLLKSALAAARRLHHALTPLTQIPPTFHQGTEELILFLETQLTEAPPAEEP